MDLVNLHHISHQNQISSQTTATIIHNFTQIPIHPKVPQLPLTVHILPQPRSSLRLYLPSSLPRKPNPSKTHRPLNSDRNQARTHQSRPSIQPPIHLSSQAPSQLTQTHNSRIKNLKPGSLPYSHSALSTKMTQQLSWKEMK